MSRCSRYPCLVGAFALVVLGLVVASMCDAATARRTFTIAPDNTTFLEGGVPTRLLSGSFHYFRAPADLWDQRLGLMAAAGLNAVQTYVAWNFHCPDQRNVCDFSGDRNLTRFFALAQHHGLRVILRPGPYICAEWDLGGFPAWILAINRTMALRSSDPQYLELVSEWFSVLYPQYIRPMLFENGGPIVLAQIENEYGTFGSDKAYLKALVQLARRHLGPNVILHSTDPHWPFAIMNSAVEGVYQTVDFFYYGTPKSGRNVTAAWEVQELAAKQGLSRPGPKMNSEFYPGWLTHWGDSSVKTESTPYVTELVAEIMVDRNATSNLNFYMFFGGTNFGFWPGYLVQTSYDYDAPISEDGRPNEPRYSQLQSMFATYLPNGGQKKKSTAQFTAPSPARYGTVTFDRFIPLYSYRFVEMVGRTVAESTNAMSMEELGQSYGYTAYSFKVNATVLSLNLTAVRDYATIFFDGVYMGFLLRDENSTLSVGDPSNCSTGLYVDTVLVIVDNNGRSNDWSAGTSNDLKGLIANVVVVGCGWSNPAVATTVTITGYLSYTLPLSLSDLNNAYWEHHVNYYPWQPILLFRGSIALNNTQQNGTYFDVRGWGRGFIMVNGHNLGRFWSALGPQYSLFCPGSWLHLDGTPNDIIILEQQLIPPFPTNGGSSGGVEFATITMTDKNYNRY